MEAIDFMLPNPLITSPPPLPIPPRGVLSPDLHAKSRRISPERKSRSRRERTSSSHEWIRILTQERRDVNDLHRDLLRLMEQLKTQTRRADEAERKACEIAVQLKTVNEAKIEAIYDASRANEELKLYKHQLERAQEEIKRAQRVVESLESQRHAAEQSAVQHRDAVHKLREEHLVYVARERGRQEGFKEGLTRGREYAYAESLSRSSSMRSLVDERYEYSPEEPWPSSSSTSEEDPRDYYPPPRSFTATPPEPPLPVPPPHSDDGIRPRVVHSLASSSRHPHVEVPPLGFIPETGADAYIRIPPPHDLDRPPPTPQQDPFLPGIPETDEEPLMVPAPGSHRRYSPMGTPHNRRSTPESASTAFSQFDVMKEPANAYAEGRSPMSVIPEMPDYRSPESKRTRDTPSLHHQRSLASMPSIVVNTVPRLSPRTVARNLADMEAAAGRGYREEPDAQLSEHAEHSGYRRQSTSSANTVPDITIDPPTRPNSATHGSSPSVPRRMGNFLSPADAHRSLYSPDTESASGQALPTPVQPSAPSVPSQTAPSSSGPPSGLPPQRIDNINDLPPGFIPAAFTPALPPDQLLPPLEETSGPAASGGGGDMPGGFYYGTQPHDGAVIPDRALYSGNLDSSDSSSVISSSLGSDADTLTTPPQRNRTSLAPTHTGGTSRQSAAGVALPPSTANETPRSFGYLYTPSTSTVMDVGAGGGGVANATRPQQAKKKKSKSSTRSGRS
ncbi:hypothetical protein HGRIS_002381 [Hohenbuehelia grisea]|uniref:Uncharacterized protein n=1 Tax=Hohenbuehelia grisea TaxID=104357 RepID=A0ABR3JKB0_9AGAR